MILGAYSSEGWDDLRWRAACIAAVIILIDREDRARGVVGTSHPRAATRMFQLLGHLTIMWSVPAQQKAWKAGRSDIDPADLPPQDEVAAYTEQVVHPVFRDAALLAAVAGVPEIAAELGDPADFFADIGLAHTKKASEPEGFRTIGAKEWAELYPINERAMRALGYRG